MSATVGSQANAPRLSAAQLRARWRQMLVDPLVAAIPFKVELNEKGAIEVTPANTRHGLLQAFVTGELQRQRPEGSTITECAAETRIGVRVPDVAWASPEFMHRHGMTSPLPRAPELCVEVLSPSNTAAETREKVAAYLAAGAREIWLVSEDGSLEIIDEGGRRTESALGIVLAPPKQ